MLSATSYALNKSNSKRAGVGLDYHGGHYRPVVKLCSSGSPAKYVTLDLQAWELVVDQLDAMDAYLQNSYSFYKNYGNPSKIYLHIHDIHFSSAYGAKAIVINERPAPTTFPRLGEEDEEAEQDVEPSMKKRKYDTNPEFIMQLATFSGLKEMRECISEQMQRLQGRTSFVNRVVEIIREFVKLDMSSQPAENAKAILKNYDAFKQYYASKRNEIDEHVKSKLDFLLFTTDSLKIDLIELYAFGLSTIAKDVYEFLFPK